MIILLRILFTFTHTRRFSIENPTIWWCICDYWRKHACYLYVCNQKQIVVPGYLTTARAHEDSPAISQLVSKKFLQA